MMNTVTTTINTKITGYFLLEIVPMTDGVMMVSDGVNLNKKIPTKLDPHISGVADGIYRREEDPPWLTHWLNGIKGTQRRRLTCIHPEEIQSSPER